jgi:hypothetical protein
VKDNCPLPVTSMNTATPPPGSVTKMIGPQCFVCMYTETGEPVEDYFAPNRAWYIYPDQVKNGLAPIIGMKY